MAQWPFSIELFELNSSSPATKPEGCIVQIERNQWLKAFLQGPLGCFNIPLANYWFVQVSPEIYNLRVEY